MLDALWQDIRYSFRGLWKARAFSTTAIATLAITIGAAVSVFTLVDSVLVRPLPYAEPDRLVVMHEVPTAPAVRGRIPVAPVNAAHFREWREGSRLFDQLAIVGAMTATLSSGEGATRVQGARVSPSFFRVLRVQPALGRLLNDAEDVTGRDRVVVIAHELWRDRLGADPSIVGRTIQIDGTSFEVVGVLPEGVRFPRLPRLVPVPMNADAPLFFKPFAAEPGDLRLNGSFNYIAVGRLNAGVDAAAAETELSAILAGLASRTSSELFQAKVVGLQEQLVGGLRAPLQLVLGAAFLVLVIACVNVANLLFARGLDRQREWSIRRAAGAGRGRLIGQSVVEAITLSFIAGVIGLVLGVTLLRVTMAYAPLELPGIETVALGGRSLLLVAALSALVGMLMAVLPAWVSGTTSPATLIRETSRTVTSGRSIRQVRAALVATEIAVSTVCLAASGLLLHSFVNLLNEERGFNGTRVQTATINLATPRYRTNDAQIAYYDTLLERTRALPGVTGAGLIDRLPVSGMVSNSALATEGTTLPRSERPIVRIQLAEPGYFSALSIPVTAGRLFQSNERSVRTAVVSERAARIIWPGEDPVGRRFRVGPDDSPLIQVIGVVGDVQAIALGEEPPMSVYLPYWQLTFPQMSLAVTSVAGETQTAAILRDLFRQLDPDLAAPTMRSMDALINASVTSRRFQMTLVLILGVAALTLAGLGVYAVMSQAVLQRTAEIGVRMAIGAAPSAIRTMVLGNALRPVVAGFAAGALASAGLRPFIEGSLFGIRFIDLATFSGTLTFVVIIAMLASYLPARRAAALNPMDALRTE